ncbi:MAG: hypothetical protein HC888_04435 [Candidatus Competibacteraceae bacterium]|nr:hypothetical protein [Candidatus Competibacteraceae bacterium]
MPLYFYLLYGWNCLNPDSVLWWRSLSILFALGAIISTYGLGRRVSGSGAGLLAALFMACSLEHIYHSQEIRMYELMAWLAVVSVNRLLDATASPTPWRWMAYASAITALGWTHPMGYC